MSVKKLLPIFRFAFMLNVCLLLWAYTPYSPPPPPEVGWEEAILPGFDPPIEYVLVYGEGGVPFVASAAQIEPLLARWGPEAGRALVQLHQDPRFEAFQSAIMRFMLQLRTPEIAELMRIRFEALILRADGLGNEALLASLDHDALREQSRQILDHSLPRRRANEPPAPPRPPVQRPPFEIRVMDGDGAPVQRIMTTAYSGTLPPLSVLKDLPDESFTPMEDAQGVFTLPYAKVLVTAPGMAAEVVTPYRMPRDGGPRRVVLRPPAAVKFEVRDSGGKTAPGVPIYTGSAAHYSGRERELRYGQTDETGAILIKGLTAGVNAFAVGERSKGMQLVLLELKPEEVQTVRVRLWPELLEESKRPFHPEALLQAWRGHRLRWSWDARLPSELVDAMAALSRRERRELAGAVRHNLALLRSPDIFLQWEHRELVLLALVSGLLQDKAALPDIERHLRTMNEHQFSAGSPAIGVALALTLYPEKLALPVLERCAAAEDASAAARTAAVFGLSQFTTPEGAEAFARLRAMAYRRPGAPQPPADYTHTLRISETVFMTFSGIPGLEWPENVQESLEQSVAYVTVDADYHKASARLRIGVAGDATFQRVGDEWLLTAFSPDPAP